MDEFETYYEVATRFVHSEVRYNPLIWWKFDDNAKVFENLDIKEILVQDHFYREIFIITSFFLNWIICLPLLMMNECDIFIISLTVRRGWAWGYVMHVLFIIQNTPLLNAYKIIFLLHFDDRAAWCLICETFLIIIWLPLSTFWKRIIFFTNTRTHVRKKINELMYVKLSMHTRASKNYVDCNQNEKKYARKVESNYYAFTHLQIWSLHTTPVKIIHALTIVNRQKESNQHLLPFLLNKSLNKAGALEPLSYSGIYIFSHFDIQSVLLESNNNQ